MFIFMFIFILFWANGIKNILILKENTVFTNFLLNIIIQDSSIRENKNNK